MRKFTILIALSLGYLVATGQTKLLVTDFIFFNNFDSPNETYIPDFFREDPEALQRVKDLTSRALSEEYDSLEVTFHDKSTWFVGYLDPTSIDPSERYIDNHKKLTKQGGYDYYLRFYADIGVTNQVNSTKEYSFSLQVRISDHRGKKVFRNISRAPFSSSFSEEAVNGGALLSKDDFFSFFEKGVPEIFKEEKIRIPSRVLQRPINSNFDDFTGRAQALVLEKSGSKSPVLSDLHGTNMELKVSQGFQNEKDPIAVFSDNLQLQTTIRIRNSAVEDDWKIWVAAASEKVLGILETGGENASIQIRTRGQKVGPFELENGQLSGKIDGVPYLLTFEPDAQLMLVYANRRLTALMQPNGSSSSSSSLKVFFEGEEEELATVINLHQVYKQAIYTLKEVRNRND